MTEQGGVWIKALTGFVVVGGIVLVGGTIALIWALGHRAASPSHVAAPLGQPAEVADVPWPADLEPVSVAAQGERILVLAKGPQGSAVAVLDPVTGRRISLLRLVPQPQ
ncbi:MAG: hypothetical protein U1E45_04865 [Geminicoccaceae bacterium]